MHTIELLGDIAAGKIMANNVSWAHSSSSCLGVENGPTVSIRRAAVPIAKRSKRVGCLHGFGGSIPPSLFPGLF
jgi:hypothetical protein